MKKIFFFKPTAGTLPPVVNVVRLQAVVGDIAALVIQVQIPGVDKGSSGKTKWGAYFTGSVVRSAFADLGGIIC